MVQRARAAREGAKRPAARKDQVSAAVPMSDAAQRLAIVEAERDRLKASLEAAEARIAELEKTRALVVNRIDWLIDSLGTVIEKRA
jgi:hypothetical protein